MIELIRLMIKHEDDNRNRIDLLTHYRKHETTLATDISLNDEKVAFMKETLSLICFFFLFASEMAGLLVAWLSTTPSYFATRLY